MLQNVRFLISHKPSFLISQKITYPDVTKIKFYNVANTELFNVAETEYLMLQKNAVSMELMSHIEYLTIMKLKLLDHA